MARSRRKERLFRERERDLLDVAAALFAERDWRAVTVDAIAERATVGKGTVYLHFRSKGEIVARLAQREIKRLLGRLAAMHPALPPAEKASRLLEAVEALRGAPGEALGWLAGLGDPAVEEAGGGAAQPAEVRAAVLGATARLLTPPGDAHAAGGEVESAAALTWALLLARPPAEHPAPDGGAWRTAQAAALTALWRALLPPA